MPPLFVSKLTKLLAIALLVGTCTPYRLPFRFPNRALAIEGYGSSDIDLVVLEGNTHEDEGAVIRRYTKEAIVKMGSPDGHYALEYLNEVTSQRKPYNFTASSVNGKDDSPMISLFPRLLPSSVLKELLRQSKDMERFMNTNLDSVDGIPSMHLNLWVNGRERFLSSDTSAVGESADKTDKFPTGYKDGVRKLSQFLRPYLRQVLLPHVRTLMNDSSIVIDEVFLRRYGDDVGRRSISAHFDSFSRVTAVIALDDVASDGANGLYTTTIGTSEPSCNHIALRRYFPLGKGDGVVHSWDVLHGVEIEPGLVRTSLIVWFVSPYDEHKVNQLSQEPREPLSTTAAWKQDRPIPRLAPWVSQRLDLATHDVAQFVLASALEASDSPDCQHNDISYELYLKSAALGNAFALDRLGWMYYEDAEERISGAQAVSAKLVLEKLQSSPKHITSLLQDSCDDDNFIPTTSSLAKWFWYEGAIRGVAQSQLALACNLKIEAEEMMTRRVRSGNREISEKCKHASQKLRLLAAVLASLAEQQGEEDAGNCLTDLVNQEIVARSIKTDAEFMLSPVVQTITAWRNIL